MKPRLADQLAWLLAYLTLHGVGIQAWHPTLTKWFPKKMPAPNDDGRNVILEFTGRDFRRAMRKLARETERTGREVEAPLGETMLALGTQVQQELHHCTSWPVRLYFVGSRVHLLGPRLHATYAQSQLSA